MKYLYTLIFFWSAAASAQFTTPLDEERGIDLVVQIMRPRIHRLGRPLITYHYRSDLENEPKTQREATGLLTNWPERFFDERRPDSNMQGPGIYVAADPLNARDFGGQTPQLFVITLKADARVLSLTNAVTNTELAGLKALDRQFGCSKDDLDGIGDLVSALRTSPSITCRHIVIEAARRLGVEAITYLYVTPEPLEGCRDSRNHAINVISTRAMDLPATGFFSDQHAFDPNGAAPMIEALYAESARDVFADVQISNVMPRMLAAGKVVPRTYADWKAQSVLSCGPMRPMEDGHEDTQWMHLFKIKHRDVEVRRTALRLKQAFEKKFKDYELPKVNGVSSILDFGLNKFLWLNHLTYRAAQLRPSAMSFADWRRAGRLINDAGNFSGDARTELLGKLLHEDPNSLRSANFNDIELESDRLIAEGAASYNLPQLFKRLGLHRRSALLATNVMTMAINGVPYLYPINAQRSAVESLRLSRATYLEILRTCLTIFEDPNLTAEQIQAGKCAIDPAPSEAE